MKKLLLITLCLCLTASTLDAFSLFHQLSFHRTKGIGRNPCTKLTILAAAENSQRQNAGQRRREQQRKEQKQPQQIIEWQNSPKQRRQLPSRQNNDSFREKKFIPYSKKLNQDIIQQPNAQQLLSLLASVKGALTSFAGSGILNSVNFSTALHRIARHVLSYHAHPDNKSNNAESANYYNHDNNDNESNKRSRILSDPRFALLVCSAAEAIADNGNSIQDESGQALVFGPREFSNMAWAIAKLKIAPPQSVLPIELSDTTPQNLRAKSEQVRNIIYNVAKERSKLAGNATKATSLPTWIQPLSELCGLFLDTISYRVLHSNEPKTFQLQEFANLLWALATAQRSNKDVYAFIVTNLIEGMEDSRNEICRPQEWSNSIWALATTGISEPSEKLLSYVNQLIQCNPSFMSQFKCQELANTAWGVAKILSTKENLDPESEGSKAALNILRHVAREVISREGDHWKSQELSNIAWSFATLGLGISVAGASDNTLHDYTILPSDDPASDEELRNKALDTITAIMKKILSKVKSQELNNLAWAMARVGYKDEELIHGIARELCHPRRQVTPQVCVLLCGSWSLYYPVSD